MVMKPKVINNKLAISQSQVLAYSNVTIDTYKPSPTLESIKIEDVRAVVTKYVLLSGVENIIDAEIIVFVCDAILDAFPKMEIAELHMAMKNGILGTYGPLYNKISVDMPMTWCKKFYDVTWPVIDKKAEFKHRQFKEDESKGNFVPVPKELQEKTNQMVKAYKMAKKPIIEYVNQYNSIEQFCIKKGYDVDRYNAELLDIILQDMPKEAKKDLWIAQCRVNHLAFLNSNKLEPILSIVNFLIGLVK